MAKKKFKNIAHRKIFESKILKAGTCWLWVGDKNLGGHPSFSWNGEYVSARRLAYEAYRRRIKWAEIPITMCGNVECIRPEHHQIVLRKDMG